ncbi:hypothetical protein LIS04_16 [Listeria phage LIS04]|nr:hypothetical protein LIS04_16 [Listeria phage LIS04]
MYYTKTNSISNIAFTPQMQHNKLKETLEFEYVETIVVGCSMVYLEV